MERNPKKRLLQSTFRAPEPPPPSPVQVAYARSEAPLLATEPHRAPPTPETSLAAHTLATLGRRSPTHSLLARPPPLTQTVAGRYESRHSPTQTAVSRYGTRQEEQTFPRSPTRSLAQPPLTQAAVSRYEARQEVQTSPHSSVQEWLDRVPQGIGLAPSRASSRHPSVMTSVVQAILYLWVLRPLRSCHRRCICRRGQVNIHAAAEAPAQLKS